MAASDSVGLRSRNLVTFRVSPESTSGVAEGLWKLSNKRKPFLTVAASPADETLMSILTVVR